MIVGLVTSLLASLALYLNAERAGKRQEVWVTTTTIAVGQVINKQNVELIRVDLGPVTENYLTKESKVMGKSALEPLTSGHLLSTKNVGVKSNLRNVALSISNCHV